MACVSQWWNTSHMGAGLVALVDVSEPRSLTPVGRVDTSDLIEDVTVVSGLAYVGEGDAGFQVIDVMDPTVPRIVGGLDTPGSAIRVAVAGDFAYVGDGDSGVQVINVSNPASPSPIATVAGRAAPAD
jgi:hypothetical protein